MSDSRLHFFDTDISENDIPKEFTFPFEYVPHKLTILAAQTVYSCIANDIQFGNDLYTGKMFGVLVVKNQVGKVGFLAGFSGNINGNNEYRYFVPPICDLLSPHNFFKKEEAEISAINTKIVSIEHSNEYVELRNKLSLQQRVNGDILDAKKQLLKSEKKRRERERMAISDDDTEQLNRLISESQRQKADYKRLEKRLLAELKDIESELKTIQKQIDNLKKERKTRSANLQERIFKEFILLNAKGERKSVYDIFLNTKEQIAPAGTGECALPKMLQYAYLKGYTPLCMGEFWWCEGENNQMRKHKHFYPSCKGKCEPILSFMLQGLKIETPKIDKFSSYTVENLEVVFEDEHIVVVNKPYGMLSVNGKDESVRSIETVVREKYCLFDVPIVIHRLDMATSGLIMFAKTIEANNAFSRLFENRVVKKRYVALLEPISKQVADKGLISLPLSADYVERPRQRVNKENGKEAVTYYEIVERNEKYSKLNFYPITGRTHQLRIHSAHSEGLHSPIIGDALYGSKSVRMFLHAESMEFIHPFTNEKISLTKENDFYLFVNFLGEPLQEHPRQ